MEPIPSNTTQVTALEVHPDDPIINDKLARGQIEQLLINALNEFVSDIVQLLSLAIVVYLQHANQATFDL
jgi:hypothetical protein